MNREAKMSRRELVLGTAEDLMTDFLYYGRKEDESLKPGEIERSIIAKEVSVDEIVAVFRKTLEGSVEGERKSRGRHG